MSGSGLYHSMVNSQTAAMDSLQFLLKYRTQGAFYFYPTFIHYFKQAIFWHKVAIL